MLEIPDSGVMFPYIKYIGKASKARGGPDSALYSLTWFEQEKELDQVVTKKTSQAHRFGFHLDDGGNISGLPLPYDKMAWDAQFAINKEYLTEIKRMTLAANNEWALERPFDTCVRERCLNPAIEYIWCAFYLISDCLWDNDGHYFDRSWLSIAMPYMLAYKFWRGQTGSGMVCDHAKIDNLRKIVEANGHLTMPHESRAPIIDLIAAIDTHEHHISERGMGRQREVQKDDIFLPVDEQQFPVDKEKD